MKTRVCHECGAMYEGTVIHECTPWIPTEEEEEPIVSDPSATLPTEDQLDALVSRGSRTRLADLYRRGKDSGLIKPGVEYQSTAQF